MSTNNVPAKGVIVAKNDPPNWYESKVKMVKCTCTWTINNFSSCSQETGQMLSSPTFTTEDSHKAKWSINLYPKGESEEYKHCVSIFLCLSSCEKATAVRAEYYLSLIDADRKKTYMKNVRVLTYDLTQSWGKPNFIKRDFLLDEANKLLPNGQLTILFELCVIEDEIFEWSKTSMHPFNVPKCQLRKNLGISLENYKLSDFTIVAGEREFHVHKLILATQSTVFSAMFDHDMKEQLSNRMDIIDIDQDVLEAMLQFIYTNEVTNLEEIADRLLAAAKKYDLDRLGVMCENMLFSSLELKNSVSILILADLHNAHQLKQQTIDFITTNSEEVVNTEGYKLLLDPLHVCLLGELFRALSSSINKTN